MRLMGWECVWQAVASLLIKLVRAVYPEGVAELLLARGVYQTDSGGSLVLCETVED